MKTYSIRDLIAAEHSSRQMRKIVKLAIADQSSFDELIKVFTGKDPELARRAAWALGHAGEEKTDFVQPHLLRILKILEIPKQHPAIYRNAFRILQYIPLRESIKARVFDLSLQYIVNAEYPGAIRAFAMSSAFNAGETYPELRKELYEILLALRPEESPAVKNRAGKILKKLRRLSE